MDYTLFLKEASRIIPSDRLFTDELRCLAWGTDAGFYRLMPKAVIMADNEEEVSGLLALSRRYHVPVTFRAAGTSLSGQSVTDSVLIVAGGRWTRFRVQEDGGVISMQPGIVGARVNAILSRYGRKIGPDPASIGSAMIGGIVNNNASGMNCGTHANSDRTMLSVRVVLSDGTVLDTGDAASREQFRASHPGFIRSICDLRDRVRADAGLSERIRKKYSIKNVTGLNIRPLIAYDDPFDIITHLISGSEGTLAFLSEVTLRTVPQETAKSTAMLYFRTMKEACCAVVELKKLTDEEGPVVKSAEMLDYKSLASVDDPVYLKYVRVQREAGGESADVTGLTAILTEVKCMDDSMMQRQKRMVLDTLEGFEGFVPFEFTEDPVACARWWAVRSGIFPSVGGTRKPGTTCLIEDVAFHIEDLPEAGVRLQQMLARHGYDDACIYGHALEGNYHFIINQDFSTSEEIARYRDLMDDVIRLVVDEYDGSLKAEHGTGRNMAPFVAHEWGDAAYEVMKEVKSIFDPDNLINPGVIFNDDPECYIRNIKPLPMLTAEGGGSQLRQKILDGINKCIECGFCEVNCVTCGFTLSSRQRIVARREIARLSRTGENDTLLKALLRQYVYPGNQTCAGDGLCSTSCPMGINVADLTHLLREESCRPGSIAHGVGRYCADHFSAVKNALRPVLTVATAAHTVLGTSLMNGVASGLHAAGLPKWTPAMPKPVRIDTSKASEEEGELKVVYFPSCINQTMGLQKDAPVDRPLASAMVSLLNKAGYDVIYPRNMENLCCGTIWESKGMPDIADRKTAELDEALWKASRQGQYPVLCDQSPCLHRMREKITRMKLYEPAEFIYRFLRDRLEFTSSPEPVAVHVTCSMRRMGLADTIISLAKLCSDNVLVPEEVGCCAFAGDRGFTHPEVNRYALRNLRPQLEAAGIRVGYSNSRTCEIGLQTNTGVPYVSIVYLVDQHTRGVRG